MLKYLKHKTGSSRKKEMTFTGQGGCDGDTYTAKISVRQLRGMSEVFGAMKKEEIKKYWRQEGMTVAALKKIVQFTEQNSVSFQNYMEALETLTVANKYKMKELQKLSEDYLINELSESNVCNIFETVTDLGLNVVRYFCLRYIDEHALVILTSRNFSLLQKSTVKEIASRDSLNINSEKVVLDSILGWVFNDILRKGLDPNDPEEVAKTVRSFLSRVRFSAMSQELLNDSDVAKFHLLTSTEGFRNRPRTMSRVSASSSTTAESTVSEARCYVTNYTANLNVFESSQRTLKTGDSFSLKVEVLKGTVFLTGLVLATSAFAATKDTACLYVEVMATNMATSEHVTNRGAFLNTSERARLAFPSPLVAQEPESMEVMLNVKRAENVCPFSIRNDAQIVMPDSQKVAMKIIPSTSTEDECRCIFKEIEYFF